MRRFEATEVTDSYSCGTDDAHTELARIIAARSVLRFVEIAPRRGVRRGDAMRKLRDQDAQRISALLEAEQERLARAWMDG